MVNKLSSSLSPNQLRHFNNQNQKKEITIVYDDSIEYDNKSAIIHTKTPHRLKQQQNLKDTAKSMTNHYLKFDNEIVKTKQFQNNQLQLQQKSRVHMTIDVQKYSRQSSQQSFSINRNSHNISKNNKRSFSSAHLTIDVNKFKKNSKNQQIIDKLNQDLINKECPLNDNFSQLLQQKFEQDQSNYLSPQHENIISCNSQYYEDQQDDDNDTSLQSNQIQMEIQKVIESKQIMNQVDKKADNKQQKTNSPIIDLMNSQNQAKTLEKIQNRNIQTQQTNQSDLNEEKFDFLLNEQYILYKQSRQQYHNQQIQNERELFKQRFVEGENQEISRKNQQDQIKKELNKKRINISQDSQTNKSLDLQTRKSVNISQMFHSIKQSKIQSNSSNKSFDNVTPIQQRNDTKSVGRYQSDKVQSTNRKHFNSITKYIVSPCKKDQNQNKESRSKSSIIQQKNSDHQHLNHMIKDIESEQVTDFCSQLEQDDQTVIRNIKNDGNLIEDIYQNGQKKLTYISSDNKPIIMVRSAVHQEPIVQQQQFYYQQKKDKLDIHMEKKQYTEAIKLLLIRQKSVYAKHHQKDINFLIEHLKINLKLIEIYLHNLNDLDNAIIFTKKGIELITQNKSRKQNLDYQFYSQKLYTIYGDIYYQKKNFKDAIKQFSTAISFLGTSRSQIETGSQFEKDFYIALYKLSLCFKQLSQFQNALQHLKLCENYYQNKLDEQDRYITTLVKTSEIYVQQQNHGQINYYTQLSIDTITSNSKMELKYRRTLAQIYEQVGFLLNQDQKYSQSIEAYKKAIYYREQLNGIQNTEVVGLYMSMIEIMIQDRQFRPAEEIVLQILESMQEQTDDFVNEIGQCLEYLCNITEKLNIKNFQEPLEYQEQAIIFYKKHLGVSSPKLYKAITKIIKLGFSLENQDQLVERNKQVFIEAIKVQKNFKNLQYLSQLATIFKQQQKHDDSATLLQLCIDLYSSSNSNANSHLKLKYLPNLYLRLGECQAIKNFKKGLEINIPFNGENDITNYYIYKGLAEIYKIQDKAIEFKYYQNKVQNIRQSEVQQEKEVQQETSESISASISKTDPDM